MLDNIAFEYGWHFRPEISDNEAESIDMFLKGFIRQKKGFISDQESARFESFSNQVEKMLEIIGAEMVCHEANINYVKHFLVIGQKFKQVGFDQFRI